MTGINGCSLLLAGMQVHFVDCGEPYVANGKVRRDLMPDILHPNGPGACCFSASSKAKRGNPDSLVQISKEQLIDAEQSVSALRRHGSPGSVFGAGCGAADG